MMTVSSVALITGASSGIGHELCLQLADKGYNIAMIARRAEPLINLRKQLEEKGRVARYFDIDVTDYEKVEETVKQIESEFGVIDLLIANAGRSGDQALDKFDVTIAKSVIDVNVIGLINTVSAVLPSMIARKDGHIVGISSLAAYLSFPKTYVYCASKAAVSSYLEGLRVEARSYGVTVSTICPGFIRTAILEGSQFFMPRIAILELKPAVSRIVQAIQSKRAFYAFPKRLSWVMRLSKFLPPSLCDLIVRQLPSG